VSVAKTYVCEVRSKNTLAGVKCKALRVNSLCTAYSLRS
jgi:hypothetical protein